MSEFLFLLGIFVCALFGPIYFTNLAKIAVGSSLKSYSVTDFVVIAFAVNVCFIAQYFIF